MLILTEKPAVAKDFASALGCGFSSGVHNSNITITNCIGHLFKEESPAHYGSDFPVIPSSWDYRLPDDEKVAKQAKLVVSLLKKHKSDTIIIATDADREGELIARECLLMAGITDFSKIKRFWVSEALTKEVIQKGLKNAKPLSEYNLLGEKAFARQHADWLTGMNFCRYISNAAGTKLTVGRVQTAILSAIEQRCNSIKNFKSEKYFEHYGIFRPTRVGSKSGCCGIYFESDETGFFDNLRDIKLKSLIGKNARLIDNKTENKIHNPPQLYNLNALQKDAFKFFGYTAEQTLKIIQSLYEDLKCVSYPRTPSRVLGSGNVELCKHTADTLCKDYPDFKILRPSMNISLSNTRCFNDAKLEAHHAIIPLKALPCSAKDSQTFVYKLILERFFAAFLPEEKYEKQTYILDVEGNRFRITGKKVLEDGWKSKDFETILKYSVPDRHVSVQNGSGESEDEQTLDSIDWNSLVLSAVETKQKWTKPPAYFNEASILSFMENPKQDLHSTQQDDNARQKKLVGLGTPATRHTFIPKLMKHGYIELQKNNFIVTELGESLLKAVRSSNIKSLADIASTTDWEEHLDENPSKFLFDIKTFVKDSVSQDVKIDVPIHSASGMICPICGKEIRKGKSNWYCTGYKDGCKFSIWEHIAGAEITENDVIAMCTGKKTGIKHCMSKAGKAFDCRFELLINNGKTEIKMVY